MSRDLLNRCVKQLIKHESELDNMPDNEHFALLKDIGEYLAKPLPEPVHMTNDRPTVPGWYWYELPESWALQPALVFDSGGEFGLFYTLDPIDSDQEDADRDGFEMDKCNENARWSSAPIIPLYAKPTATEQKPNYPERMSDDDIAVILEKLDFNMMSTADDLFYLIARDIEQEAYKRALGIKERE